MQLNQIIQKQRRSKERYVFEANNLVQQWRDLYENGYIDYAGQFIKPTLQQAATQVGCSKKTLEDYYSIIRKASEIIDIKTCFHQKMGYLRKLLRMENLNEAAPEIEPEIEQQTQNEQENEWDNMIIEAEVESRKSESNIDNYFIEDSHQYQQENDFTQIEDGYYNNSWKITQIEVDQDFNEYSPAQPNQDISFGEF